MKPEVEKMLEYQCKELRLKFSHEKEKGRYIIYGQGDKITRVIIATRAKKIVVAGETWEIEEAMHILYNMGNVKFGFSELIFVN